MGQGCPLPPLRFVLAVDGLLRRLALESSSTFASMYADDTAMVMQDFQRELTVLAVSAETRKTQLTAADARFDA